MDNKNFIGWQDRIRVDLNDPNEVEYFHSKHSLFSHKEIKDAIKLKGPFRSDIESHLVSIENKRKQLVNWPGGFLGGPRSSLLDFFRKEKK